MPVALLTGFEPFGGEAMNASLAAVRLLDGEQIGGLQVVVREIPCVFGACGDALAHEIEAPDPAILIGVGQAAGRASVDIERIAVNLDDCDHPDNAGAVPRDCPIVEGGPAAYLATLPVGAIVEAIRAADIPARASLSAGSFVCNHFFYAASHLAATRRPDLRVGFVHLPVTPAQAAAGRPELPSLATAIAADALRIVVRVSAAALSAVPVGTRIAGGGRSR